MESAQFIEISAEVSYWEDAYLNDEEDVQGKIPFRNGDFWSPVIDLTKGVVVGWPKGLVADVNYKVRDSGTYWLLDANKNRIAKWKDSYVPDSILCIDAAGYGDYISFTIDDSGSILDWVVPEIDEDEWESVVECAAAES